MREIIVKVGSNILPFTSHFADLMLLLCPFGLGLTRRGLFFSWQTLYLPLLKLNLTLFVVLYLNATVKMSTLNWWTCIFTRFHGAAQRPGSGGSSLSFHKSPVFLSDFLHFRSAPTNFQETAGTRFPVCPLLELVGDVRASRRALAETMSHICHNTGDWCHMLSSPGSGGFPQQLHHTSLSIPVDKGILLAV